MKDEFFEDVTASDLIIAFLFSCRSTKIMRSVLRERILKRRGISSAVFSQNLYRLKRRNIIEYNRSGDIKINTINLKNFSKYKYILTKPNFTNNILMIFDIPEKDRRIRAWLRGQIKLWDFKMIQKSVWIGNGPLPKEFNDRIKFLGIDKYIKIFNVQRKSK